MRGRRVTLALVFGATVSLSALVWLAQWLKRKSEPSAKPPDLESRSHKDEHSEKFEQVEPPGSQSEPPGRDDSSKPVPTQTKPTQPPAVPKKETPQEQVPDQYLHSAGDWSRNARIYGHGAQVVDMSSLRAARIQVQQQTVFCCEQQKYWNKQEWVPLADTITPDRTTVYDVVPNPTVTETVPLPSFVEVCQGDCFEAGLELQDELIREYETAEVKPEMSFDEYTRVGVLNMANEYRPGGGWQGGAGAQEENLFRRSNLFQFLARGISYPIVGKVLISHGVSVFRGSEDLGYPFLPFVRRLDIITAGAVAHPTYATDDQGRLRLENGAAARNFEKIYSILDACLRDNLHTIVLSALGCGAFANPPEHIAELFYMALSAKEFQGKFRKIVFAIFDDHNSRKRHNPRGNVLPFSETFQTTPRVLPQGVVYPRWYVAANDQMWSPLEDTLSDAIEEAAFKGGQQAEVLPGVIVHWGAMALVQTQTGIYSHLKRLEFVGLTASDVGNRVLRITDGEREHSRELREQFQVFGSRNTIDDASATDNIPKLLTEDQLEHVCRVSSVLGCDL